MKSCHEYYVNGITATGDYYIDPDGIEGPLQPVKIRCEMDNDRVQSQFTHDQNAKLFINPSSMQVNSQGIAVISLKYQLGLETLKGIIKSSLQCYQRLSYECSGKQLRRVEFYNEFFIFFFLRIYRFFII